MIIHSHRKASRAMAPKAPVKEAPKPVAKPVIKTEPAPVKEAVKPVVEEKVENNKKNDSKFFLGEDL